MHSSILWVPVGCLTDWLTLKLLCSTWRCARLRQHHYRKFNVTSVTLFSLSKRKWNEQKTEERKKMFVYLSLIFPLERQRLEGKNNGKIGIAWHFVLCSAMLFSLRFSVCLSFLKYISNIYFIPHVNRTSKFVSRYAMTIRYEIQIHTKHKQTNKCSNGINVCWRHTKLSKACWIRIQLFTCWTVCETLAIYVWFLVSFYFRQTKKDIDVDIEVQTWMEDSPKCHSSHIKKVK